MDENGAGPSKPLTLKIRIPALKRAQRPPTPPPAPEDASSDESRSASPISIDEAASNVTSALPSAATTSFSLPQPLPNKPKKKPKPKSKLFSRVTTTPRLPPTDPNYVKKLPKLKPLNELLPRLISRLKKYVVLYRTQLVLTTNLGRIIMESSSSPSIPMRSRFISKLFSFQWISVRWKRNMKPGNTSHWNNSVSVDR